MTKKTIQETLFDITPEIEALAQMTMESNAIDKELYAFVEDINKNLEEDLSHSLDWKMLSTLFGIERIEWRSN